MLCLILGTGLILATWCMLLAAVVVFVIGTQIRVRIEDSLLEQSFGAAFLEYQRGVPAYIPFVK
jgi:protein-S-isoprenylcysteine O-methyltransferase Ste14